MLKILYILFFSSIVPQGMYVDKEAITVYSLNLETHSFNNNQIGPKNDYWCIGLSSVIKGKNE